MQNFRLQIVTLLLISITWLAGCDNEDPAPTAVVEFPESSYNLNEDASAPLTLTVEVSPSWSEDVTVPLSFGGSAVEGTDYETVANKNVVIPAGSTSASVEITPIDNNTVDGERTIVVTASAPADIPGITVGATGEVTITLVDNDEAGASTVDFAQAEVTTNEYDQETVQLTLNLSEASIEEEIFTFTVGGTAVEGTNYSALTTEVTVPAGETSAMVEVPILNSMNYGETSTIEISLIEPENEVFDLGANAKATITIINPIANTTLFAPTDDFARLYAYNTFEEGVEVPETGRQNSDPAEGVVFDESFAFTFYPLVEEPDENADPNVFGFQSDLWTEEEFTRSTNVFNIIEIYGDDGNPGTIDTGISSGSAGLRLPYAIRLIPDAVGATSGRAVIIADEITVYYPDETEDDVTNPESFIIKISGKGTYDEVAGEINIPITFDASSIDDGVKTLNFVFEATRR